MVLDGDGQLLVAGWNDRGQLGLSKYPSKSFPTQMPTLSDVSAIGGAHGTCWARKSDGGFVMWGRSNYSDSNVTFEASAFQTPTGYPTSRCASNPGDR